MLSVTTHRLLLALFAVLACAGIVATDRLGIGDNPQHGSAYLTWWPSPGRVGGTITLNDITRSAEGLFGNDENQITFTPRFVRNRGTADVYSFRVRLNDRDPETVLVAFDGQPTTIYREPGNGVALTIENADPFSK